MSIVAQRHRPIEILVVEDGCTGALNAVQVPRDDTLSIRSMPNFGSGRSQAGNTGLLAARGTYIGFLDDDDELFPDHVTSLLSAIRNDGTAAAYAWSWCVSTRRLSEGDIGLREGKRYPVRPTSLTPAALTMRNVTPIQSVLVHRSLFDELGGFDEKLDYLEDWDLWLRYTQHKPFSAVHKFTSLFRIPMEPDRLASRAAAHGAAVNEVRKRILLRAERVPPRTPPSRSSQASVIIVNFNAGPHLLRCLRSLRDQEFENFDAIVIDNASTDDSFENALMEFSDARFRYFRLPINTGFAAANNFGALLAHAPWLVTLNPDAFPEPRWLSNLLDGAQRHADASMFGSTQLADATPSLLDGAGDCYLFFGIPWRGGHGKPAAILRGDVEPFGPCAAAAMYRRQLFQDLGGFDERLFCYLEDVDLAYRWRLMGERAMQIHDAVVRHVGSASSQDQSGSGHAPSYYGMRNLFWVFLKNTPAPLLWVALPLHLLALLILVAKAAMRRKGLLVLRALAHSLLGVRHTLIDRRRIQSRRRASTATIAIAMTWNPWRYLRRTPPV